VQMRIYSRRYNDASKTWTIDNLFVL